MRHINKHIKRILVYLGSEDLLPLDLTTLDTNVFNGLPAEMSVEELVETVASLLHELEQRVHNPDPKTATGGLIPALKLPELRMLVTKAAQVIHDILVDFSQYDLEP